MSSSLSSDADFEHMFEIAPVSLWLEDFSDLKRLLDGWRAAGVQDVAAHVRSHPECMQQYGAAIKVLKVNQRTLDLFAAPDQATLVASLGTVFRGDMHAQAIAELLQLWSGALEFSNQTPRRRAGRGSRCGTGRGRRQRWPCAPHPTPAGWRRYGRSS